MIEDLKKAPSKTKLLLSSSSSQAFKPELAQNLRKEAVKLGVNMETD